MTRERLLKRLDAAWTDFTSAYAGLSDAELLAPGVTKVWSVRDIIAHVTTWEEEAVKHLLACGYPACAGGMMASASDTAIKSATDTG